MFLTAKELVIRTMDLIEKERIGRKQFPDTPSKSLTQDQERLRSLCGGFALAVVLGKKNCLICSSQYSPLNILIGLMSVHSGIPLVRLIHGMLGDRSFLSLVGSASAFYESPLWFSVPTEIDEVSLNDLGIQRVLTFSESSLDIRLVTR